jgi:acetyl/propionyl-CoA carboxylase alpha subunit
VAGLPTNVSFLRRLASHEAFQACELDTGFIQRHADTLLHVPPASPQLAALAAVARVKLQQREQQEQQGAQGAAALGPWGVSDGKRLWQQLVQRCDMTYPDAGQQLRPTVTYLDNGSFTVTLPADSDSSGDGRSGHSGHSVAHSHAPPTTVHVSHVGVCGDSLTAEVEGQRVSASLLLHSHVQERVMELWLAGEHHTFRWGAGAWACVHCVHCVAVCTVCTVWLCALCALCSRGGGCCGCTALLLLL